MHWRERSIRERFERQACSHCGAGYPPEGVVVVAHRGNVYVLLASCDRCQHRALFLVSFPQHSTEPVSSAPASLSMASHPTIATAVTTTDVEQMHRFLESFDGDFQRLFGE